MSDPISETDAIFARAYASAIKNKFSLDFGSGHILFLSPLVMRGIPSGNLIYPEMTNFLTYRFGDAILAADNPTYLGGGVGSYIQELRTYIDYIYTKVDRSPAVIREMAKARTALNTANDNYDEALDRAIKEWKTQHDAGDTDQKFWDWTQHNAKYLQDAVGYQTKAQMNFDSVAEQYYGSDSAALADIRGGIRKAMETNPQSKSPGYNQAGLTADKDLIRGVEEQANDGKKVPHGDIEPYIVQVPDYGIQGYDASMNDWMRKAADAKPKRDHVLTINVNEGRETSWQDYGYKEIHGSGNIGIFPFFNATARYGDKEEKYVLKTEGRETEISYKVAAIGMQLFPVNAAQWDVPNIKMQFPELIGSAPEVLDSKNARPVSVLVGYDIAFTVTFGASMKKEVKAWLDKAKSTGGSLTIFGFRVSGEGGGGLSDQVNTSFDGVEWDEASGTITMVPASKQVYPSVLAVLGQRF